MILPAAAWRAGPTPGRPAAGWRWPLPGRPAVVRGFDPPNTPYGPGHRGVDLAAAPGTAVLAAGPGVIAYAGVLAGRGVVSILHASGLRTTYEPVAAAVSVGTEVRAGSVIGHLAAGHPGCGQPACLHWGLRRGEVYLDPLLLLRPGPVRLLPRTDVGAATTADSTTTRYRAGAGGPPGGAGAAVRTTTGHRAVARAGPVAAVAVTVALGWLAFRRRAP